MNGPAPGRSGNERIVIRMNARLVFGIVVIVIGVLFTLDNFDVLEADNYLRFWPLVLVIFGVVQTLQPSSRAARGVGVILIVVGAWLLLGELGLIDWSLWDLWPVVLILIGATLVWRALGGGGGDTGDVASASTVSVFAFINGVVRRSNSKSFRQADLTAVMGGCELDLRDASTAEAQAVIDTFAFWGGIEIKVPEDWSVTCTAVPVLGGVDDKTRLPAGDTGKRLLVKGMAIMGGIEITN